MALVAAAGAIVGGAYYAYRACDYESEADKADRRWEAYDSDARALEPLYSNAPTGGLMRLQAFRRHMGYPEGLYYRARGPSKFLDNVHIDLHGRTDWNAVEDEDIVRKEYEQYDPATDVGALPKAELKRLPFVKRTKRFGL